MLVALTVVLSACLIAQTEEPEAGPEQFAFTMVPGSGPGPEANEAVDDNTDDANHVAWVETPLGRLDLYTYTAMGQGPATTCMLIQSAMFGSTACGDTEAEFDDDEVRLRGVGVVDDWAMVEIGAGDNVASIVLSASDARVYRSNVVEGWAIVVYPAERGNATIQGLDMDGNPVGTPVTAELP